MYTSLNSPSFRFEKGLGFKISGQTVVKRGIAMTEATDALIGLIKEHGRWVDPPVADE